MSAGIFAQVPAGAGYPKGSLFIPATADAKPYDGKLGRLPTGCAEFEVNLPSPKSEIVVNAADFGLNENIENAATVINNALAHCKKVGASKLVIAKGVYKIYENTPINIVAFKDFTFDGGGSTFVYRKDSAPNFYIAECLRVKLCNFNVDYDWQTQPLASIVEVVGLDKSKESPTIDFKFVDYREHAYYKKPMMFTALTAYDPEAKSVGIFARRPIYGKVASMLDEIVKYEWLSPNVVRCRFKNDDMPKRAEVGWFYRAQHFYYQCDCFSMLSNTHLTFADINVYSCKGCFMRVNGTQKYWQVVNVNLAPPKGDVRRCITSTADGIHIGRSCGYFKLVGCDISYGADDGVNIHDCTEFVVRVNDHTVRINRPTSAKYIGEDSVFEFRHWDYAPTNFTAKLKEKKKTGNTFELVFEEKLPDDLGKGFVLFDRKYGSKNFLAKNCKFHRNRARGILILTDNVTIENCVFERIDSGAMKIETGHADVWSEGYGVNNMVVRNCTFIQPNLFGGSNQGIIRDISMNMYIFKDNSMAVKAYPMLRNILFENNKFIDQIGTVAFLGACDNVIFRNNEIVNESKLKTQSNVRGGFFTMYSKNVKIVNNTYRDSQYLSSPGVAYDPETTENVIAAGNRIVSE